MAGYFEHTTGPGERWDLIAWRYYRDVSRQSVLIAANRHLFLRDDDIGMPPPILPAGATLRVPVIEVAPDDSALPPWKRGRSRA